MDRQSSNWQDLFNQMKNFRRSPEEGEPKPPKPPKPVRQVRHGELKALLITLIGALVLFYFMLPAINLHAEEFYSYIAMVLVLWTVVRIPLVVRSRWQKVEPEDGMRGKFKSTLPLFFPIGILAALVVIAGIGSLLGAPILRSSDYCRLIEVEEGEFTQDVGAVTYNQIPLLDKASAQKLGDRKLGTLADMVSQFEVANNYTQINYHGRPVRATPLLYGDLFKWFNNRRSGLPAYLLIDMITQEVEVVRLSDLGLDGIHFSGSEPFFRNAYRTLRFQYPTFLFGSIDFEVDEQGVPYWIASRVVKRIGLFGGDDVAGAVLLNAVTGESEYYPVEQVPAWVDNVFDPELIINQYDYFGKYSNGFWNATFGQRNVVMTTEGYNYIALGDDVYMYTGITSVGRDESNIGFILSNMRTKATKFYSIAGAEEYSAMNSARGAVQHLGYDATFPLLLNIGEQPTYVIALKDDAGLVKMYAMVNVSRYQIVATGSSIAETERRYLELLSENDLYSGEISDLPIEDEDSGLSPDEIRTVTGRIAEIRSSVINGTSMYYLRLENGSAWFVVSAARTPAAVLLNPGDQVVLRCGPEEPLTTVLDFALESVPQAFPQTAAPELPSVQEQPEPDSPSPEVEAEGEPA